MVLNGLYPKQFSPTIRMVRRPDKVADLERTTETGLQIAMPLLPQQVDMALRRVRSNLHCQWPTRRRSVVGEYDRGSISGIHAQWNC